MRKTLNKKIEKKIILKENDKKTDESLQNLKISTPPITHQQIKKTIDGALSNKKKLIINKETLELMSKEAIILHCLNLNKTVEAAVKVINDIKYLKKKKKFDDLPENLKEIAEARLKNPNASLKELGESLKIPLGKSGVNHRLKKISEIAEDIRGNK